MALLRREHCTNICILKRLIISTQSTVCSNVFETLDHTRINEPYDAKISAIIALSNIATDEKTNTIKLNRIDQFKSDSE